MKSQGKKILELEARVLEMQNLNAYVYSILLDAPEIAKMALPGQFLMVKVKTPTFAPLWRRAFSISRIYDGKRIELLIQEVGTGTSMLRQTRPGEQLSLLGPLGNSFDINAATDKNAIIVVGGIGVAPAFILHDSIRTLAKSITIFYGARTSEHLIPMNELEPNTKFVTENGSRGEKGYVTDALVSFLENNYDIISNCIIYACGPSPMLNALHQIHDRYGIRIQVSVETLMACGIGVCMGCPVERKDLPGEYYYACKDGPVFELNSIKLNHTI